MPLVVFGLAERAEQQESSQLSQQLSQERQHGPGNKLNSSPQHSPALPAELEGASLQEVSGSPAPGSKHFLCPLHNIDPRKHTFPCVGSLCNLLLQPLLQIKHLHSARPCYSPCTAHFLCELLLGLFVWRVPGWCRREKQHRSDPMSSVHLRARTPCQDRLC